MYIYSIRNRKVGFYNSPFFADADSAAIDKSYQRLIALDPVKAKSAHLDESELYLIGTFNDLDCSFQLLNKPEYISDLGTYFAKEIPTNEN